MANTVIGALSVKITADASGVKDGIAAAGDALKIGEKQIRKSADKFVKWGAAGVAAAAAVTAAMVKMNLATIKELRVTAESADMTVAAFQRGAFAANKFGVSQEKYGDILKDVNDRVGDFLISGAGPMVDFFETIAPKVGITAKAFKDLSGEQSLALYVKSLQDAGVSQQEMTFFMEAMSSESTKLIPLLKDNAAELQRMTKRAEDLGIGLTETQVAMAGLASQELSDTSAQFKGLTQLITIELSPILIAVSKNFTEMANQGGGAATYITTAIDGLVSAVGFVADAIHGWRVILKGVQVIALGVVAAIGTALKGMANGISLTVDGLLGMANMAIKQFNKLPGIDIKLIQATQNSDFIKNIDADAKFLVDTLTMAKGELHDLAVQELPSDTLKRFVAEAREEFAGLAAAIVEDKKKAKDNGEGVGVKETSVAADYQAETIGLMEAIGLRYLSEEEAELAHLQRQMEMQKQALAEKRVTQKEHDDAMVGLKQKTEDAERKMTLANVQNGFKILAEGSKKAQKLYKAVAIYKALIAGKESAIQAWKSGMEAGGPILAAAYTAASIATTASMISGIKGGGSSAGGGTASPSASAASPSSASQQTAQNVPQMNRTIDISLPSTGLLSVDQVRELMAQINEQVGDGVQLTTTGGT
tara:strand:+ start:10056 stop:12002 length:1947 start_codon:yes stop_codon:yes gene_type:complete